MSPLDSFSGARAARRRGRQAPVRGRMVSMPAAARRPRAGRRGLAGRPGPRRYAWPMRRSARHATLVTLLVLLGLALGTVSVDGSAAEATQVGLKRALITFAAARGLNATLSVFQSAQVSGQFLVGGSISPGQVLEPLNRLIEAFSSVMLAVSVVFGLQLVLLKMGAHWLVSAVLAGVAVLWGFSAWRGHAARAWLTPALVFLLMLRFALPFAVVGSEAAFQRFMADDYAAAQGRTAAAPPAALDPPAPAASQPGGLDALARLLDQARNAADIGRHIDTLKHWAEDRTEHVVKLMVVFVLQTLLLPLLLVWVFWRAVRLLTGMAAREVPADAA